MKVSVCMITYNHEKYISQAIEGVLMQQASFDYELVIGEDCSTDNTRSIILEYHEKYPDKIRLLLPDSNIGMMPNFIATLKACSGEYLALCEGDDYWIDPLKLQKQIDFLDSHEGYSSCFTNSFRLENEDQDSMKKILHEDQDKTYTIRDIVKTNLIPTATTVFRKSIIAQLPEWFSTAYPGDWVLHILNSIKGDIRYLHDVTSVYRMHSGGTWTGGNIIENNAKTVSTLILTQDFLPNQYKSLIKPTIAQFYLRVADFSFQIKDYDRANISLLNYLKTCTKISQLVNRIFLSLLAKTIFKSHN